MIDVRLQQVEDVIAALSGRVLAPDDAHPALVAIGEVLGSRPYAVLGPRARFRWKLDGLMVEAGVDQFFDEWEVGYRAFPYEPDVSQGEYLAFTYASPDLSPPYLWSLALTEPPAQWWSPPAYRLPGWNDVATEFGYLTGMLAKDLATIPPAWFDAPVVLSSALGDTTVEVSADRHGLRVCAPGTDVTLDPDQAYRAGRVLGRSWAGAYAAHRPADLAISTEPPAFALFAVPGGTEGGDDALEAATFAELQYFRSPVERRARRVFPLEGFVTTYADPHEAADLVVEAVEDGIAAFLERHTLVAVTNRFGTPELRAAAGWRVRVRSGTLDLTVLESWDSTEQVLAYTRALLAELTDTYGDPWGCSRDSRDRLSRTWRVGDLAIRVGAAATAVVAEVTSYRDLLTYHFG